MRPPIPLSVLLVFLISPHWIQAQSFDIAVADNGLNLGNSDRFTGIRVNAGDQGVEIISGLNFTFWTPGEHPNAEYAGLAVGLIGTKARRISGDALSGIKVNAREHLTGIAAGTLGVGAGKLTSSALGMILVDIKERVRGVAIAGAWTGASQQFDGLAWSRVLRRPNASGVPPSVASSWAGRKA